MVGFSGPALMTRTSAWWCPSQPTKGCSTATRAKHKSLQAEQRFLTSLVPVPADGAKTLIYVGPKDHRQAASASDGPAPRRRRRSGASH